MTTVLQGTERPLRPLGAGGVQRTREQSSKLKMFRGNSAGEQNMCSPPWKRGGVCTIMLFGCFFCGNDTTQYVVEGTGAVEFQFSWLVTPVLSSFSSCSQKAKKSADHTCSVSPGRDRIYRPQNLGVVEIAPILSKKKKPPRALRPDVRRYVIHRVRQKSHIAGELAANGPLCVEQRCAEGALFGLTHDCCKNAVGSNLSL